MALALFALPSFNRAVIHLRERLVSLAPLIQKLLQILPVNEDDMVVLDGLLELGAGDDVVVALPPGGSVVGMIDGDGLKLGIIVAEVDNQLPHARLQVLDL